MSTLIRISTGASCQVLSVASDDFGAIMFLQLPALAKGMECDQFEKFQLTLNNGSMFEFNAQVKATRQCSKAKSGLMQRKYKVTRSGTAAYTARSNS